MFLPAAAVDPAGVLLDAVSTTVDENLTAILAVVAVLVGVGVAYALIKRFIPGA